MKYLLLTAILCGISTWYGSTLAKTRIVDHYVYVQTPGEITDKQTLTWALEVSDRAFIKKH